MQLVVTWQLDENVRVRPGAFDRQVGKTIPFRMEGIATSAKILKAVVSEDGRSVDLGLDVNDIDGAIASLVDGGTTGLSIEKPL